MRRLVGVVVVLLFAAAVVSVSGVTDAFGTGAQIHTNLGGPFPDGAERHTFWDSPVVDLPGVSVTGVHCHGTVQYELQVAATGPSHENACYAAMDNYTGYAPDESEWGVYTFLPGGLAVYRVSQNWGPWRYCVAEPVTYASPAEVPIGQVLAPPC